jgi:hypothetical protein
MSETVGQLDARFTVDLSNLDRGLRAAGKKLNAFSAAYEDTTEVQLRSQYRDLVSGLKTASRALDNFKRKSDATVEIKERGSAQTTAALGGVGRAVSNINGENATVRVGERGAASTTAAMHEIFSSSWPSLKFGTASKSGAFN